MKTQKTEAQRRQRRLSLAPDWSAAPKMPSLAQKTEWTRKLTADSLFNEIRRRKIKAIEKEIVELKDNLNAKHDEWMEKLCEHRENGGTLSHTTTYMLRNW